MARRSFDMEFGRRGLPYRRPGVKEPIVLLDFGDFRLTLRELVFSFFVLGVMSFLGFLVHSCVDKHVGDSTLKYRQAVAIGSESEFRHAMDTDVGHAFVRGRLAAANPVRSGLVEGEYLRIYVKHQKYQKHTRVVTYVVHDSKGNAHTRTRTETYWSWDTVDSSESHSPKVLFNGSEFAYGKFNYAYVPVKETIVGGGLFKRERDVVYTTKDGFDATIFADLGKGSFKGQATLVFMGIEAYRKSLADCVWPYAVFWVTWVVMTAGALVMFYFPENDWLED